MNYQFTHLKFLAEVISNGDKLRNEDYIFLTSMRDELKIANEHMKVIDETIMNQEQYA